MERRIVWEGETGSGHHQIIDCTYDGRPARVLYSGQQQAAQSGIPKDDRAELLFDYNQRLFELITSVRPQRLLLVGGSIGVLPQALAEALPEVTIDSLEPDEQIVELGYRYFGFCPNDRIRHLARDGSSYLEDTAKTYDMLVIDAFEHTTIPPDLTTTAAITRYAEHLQPGGMVAMNIISSYLGRGCEVVQGIATRFSEQFSSVELFLAGVGYSLWLPQNFVLVAQRNKASVAPYMRYKALALE